MTDIPKSPFRKVLDEIDTEMLSLLQAITSVNEDQLMKKVNRLIDMRKRLLEPYSNMTPIRRASLQ